MVTSLDSVNTTSTLLEKARHVITTEMEALQELNDRLDDQFVQAVDILAHCRGRVVVTGMGKSGLIGKKIAATLSSTGTPALFLHPAEGSHGDLGTLMANDAIIAISNSGETPEILGVLPLIKRFDLPLIGLTGNPESTLARRSNVVLSIAVRHEACPFDLAPTASTTVTLALGDALAIVLLEKKGFSKEDFALFHPAGALGKRLLLKVEDLMHRGEAIPMVVETTPFLDALMEITSKKLGLTLVLDTQGKMMGIITDGDIRRVLTMHQTTPQYLHQLSARDVMTAAPKTIPADALAVSALRLMEQSKITSLAVLNEEDYPLGVVHMHDILKTGIT